MNFICYKILLTTTLLFLLARNHTMSGIALKFPGSQNYQTYKFNFDVSNYKSSKTVYEFKF